MPDLPDIEGFKEAQARLVSYLGNTVLFEFPVTYAYASGVYIDPESGVALDPTVSPTTTVQASAISVQATKVNSIPAIEEDGTSQRAGIIPQGKVWIRIPEGTYPSGILAAATFSVHDQRYIIERFSYDGIASAADRLYVMGELLDDGAGPVVAPSGGVVGTVGAYTREQFIATAGQTVFTTSVAFIPGSTWLFVDGVNQSLVTDYSETPPQTVTITTPAEAGQVIQIRYQIA